MFFQRFLWLLINRVIHQHQRKLCIPLRVVIPNKVSMRLIQLQVDIATCNKVTITTHVYHEVYKISIPAAMIIEISTRDK